MAVFSLFFSCCHPIKDNCPIVAHIIPTLIVLSHFLSDLFGNPGNENGIIASITLNVHYFENFGVSTNIGNRCYVITSQMILFSNASLYSDWEVLI